MIEFTQTVHNLIGSQDAVNQLAAKDNARVLAISDSHGGYSVFSTIVRNFGSDCDALIFCGDGAGDLAKLINEALADKSLLKCIPPVIAFVQGNNDPSSYPVNAKLNLTCPQRQLLSVCGKNVLIVHGHRQGVNFGFESLAFEAQMTESRFCVYGHTHISGEDYFGKDNEYKLINPGSCTRPRGGLPPSFAILTFTRTFEDTAFIKLYRQDGKEQFGVFNPF